MSCPDCGGDVLAFPFPDEHLRPGEEPGVALCTRCLRIHPHDDPPAAPPDFRQVSDAFPADPDAAVPLAVLVGLLENLAHNRSEIATLLERMERAGTDPLLALDRLAADGGLDPHCDLAGRRRQLEQLL